MSRQESPYARGFEAGFKAGWKARETKAVEAMAEMMLLVKPTDIIAAEERIAKRAQRTDGRDDYTGGPVEWDDPAPITTIPAAWSLHVHSGDHRPTQVSFAYCSKSPCRNAAAVIRADVELAECKDAAHKHRARHGGNGRESFMACASPPCSLFWLDIRSDVYRRYVDGETPQ